LTTLAAQGRGLLIATHDVDFAHDFATRVVVLADGVMVEQGPAKDVLANPTHPATKALLES
jgi:polar amino acid transport system ATP-binding protein